MPTTRPSARERVYIYIYSLGRRLSPPSRMVSGKRKKRKKGSSWKIIIPPLDSGRPRRGLSPLNIEILGLPPFIWMDLSSPLQVSMIFRDLYIESHRGVETPFVRGPCWSVGNRSLYSFLFYFRRLLFLIFSIDKKETRDLYRDPSKNIFQN